MREAYIGPGGTLDAAIAAKQTRNDAVDLGALLGAHAGAPPLPDLASAYTAALQSFPLEAAHEQVGPQMQQSHEDAHMSPMVASVPHPLHCTHFRALLSPFSLLVH